MWQLWQRAGRAGGEESSESQLRTQEGLFPAVGWALGGLTVRCPCREHLEKERVLDGRYRLQEVPCGRVALPVLEEKLSQLQLPQEMPCRLVWIQVGRDPSP